MPVVHKKEMYYVVNMSCIEFENLGLGSGPQNKI